MLQAAQAKGLNDSGWSQVGAAFISRITSGGGINPLDEEPAMPLGFAKELQQARLPASAEQPGSAYEAGCVDARE